MRPVLGSFCVLGAMIATALSIAMFAYPLVWALALAWGLGLGFYVLAAARRGRVLTPVPLLAAASSTAVLFGPVVYTTGAAVALPWAGLYAAMLLGGGASMQMMYRPPKPD